MRGLGDALINVSTPNVIVPNLFDSKEVQKNLQELEKEIDANGDITYTVPNKSSPLLKHLKNGLVAAGITEIKNHLSDLYDLTFEKAINAFKKRYNLKEDGTVDKFTLQNLLDVVRDIANKMPEDDTVNDDDVDNDNQEYDESVDPATGPHYLSFFSQDNEKTFRQNKNDIVIRVGNQIVKTIKDVHMRSLGMEFDASGNAISETYEFVAKDVTESDEPKDIDKYISESHKSSSEIEYKFNFGETKNE